MVVECVQILNLSAVILANLCVSYIMSSQTEDAEELMRKIEKEEVGCVLMEVGCVLTEVGCVLTEVGCVLMEVGCVLMEDRLKLVVCVCVCTYAGEAVLRGPRSQAVPPLYCEPCHWDTVLCQGQL